MPVSLFLFLVEASQSALENRVASFEEWLKFWTAVVVLGLLYEYGYELLEPPHSKRSTELWPFRYALRLTKLGAVFVTVGVAGELYVEVMSSPAQEALRQFNNKQLTALNQEAGEARKEAGLANERAAVLESENLKLRQLVQPRSLALDQIRGIGYALRRFSGRTVEVSSGAFNPESYFLSENIVIALKKAGFVVNDRSGGDLGSPGAGSTGVRIIHSTAQRDVAESIRRALIEQGGMERKNVHMLESNPLITGPGNVHTIDPRPYLWLVVLARPLPKLD